MALGLPTFDTRVMNAGFASGMTARGMICRAKVDAVKPFPAADDGAKTGIL